MQSIKDAEKQSSPNQIVRLTSTEEVIAEAFLADNKGKKFQEPEGVEKFHYEIYSELFDNVSYRLEQIKSLFHSDFPWTAVKRSEERLLTSLEGLENGITEYYKFIKAKLLSEKKNDVMVAVFVLSSVKNELFSALYLEHVTNILAETEEEYLQCFIEGLKYGLNKNTGEHLKMISELVPPAVKSACLEVIEYRNNFNIDILYWKESRLNSSCIIDRQSNKF